MTGHWRHEPDVTPVADPENAPMVVEECPDGPLLLRGAAGVLDQDGVLHEAARPVVAVCRCGRSQRRPWCDGTHKAVRRD
ncbi:MAG: CDGSH iron-sulfur domain-containing protein [Nocardioidaceae bacterium]